MFKSVSCDTAPIIDEDFSVFKAAIFDMDGLLIDSERIIMRACIQAAHDVGIEYRQEQYVELIGRSAPDSTRVMTEQLKGREKFNLVMQGLDRILAQRDNSFPLKEGAEEVIRYFTQQALPCAVASSSHQSIIRHRLTSGGVYSL